MPSSRIPLNNPTSQLVPVDYRKWTNSILCWSTGTLMAIVIQVVQLFSLHIHHGDAISFSSWMKVDVVACLSLLCSINMMALAYDGPPGGDPLNSTFYDIQGIVLFTRCSLVTNLTLGIMIFYYISNI